MMTYIMPYVSFKESDCYIYNDDDKGLVCLSCLISPKTTLSHKDFLEGYETNEQFVTGDDWQAMLDHINDHREKGHNIPMSADNFIRYEWAV